MEFSVYPDQGPKPQPFYYLICGVGRVKFHDTVIFIIHAKTDNALPAVYIIAPQGDTPDPCHPRQEAGEC
jgi:hypothetical protein